MVKLNTPLSFDDLTHTPSGPEIGGKTERPRRLAEPGQNLSDLSGLQLGGPTRLRLGIQAGFTVTFVGRPPLADGPDVNFEKLGHRARGHALLESVNREPSPPLQFGSRAGSSHDPYYAPRQWLSVFL